MEHLLQQHLQHIKSLWFIIEDEEKILWYLRWVGYYRLRKYFNIFEDKNRDFQDVIHCYLFDKNLRVLNLNMIESIEVYIKNIFILKFWNNYNNEDLYSETFREKRIQFIKDKVEELKVKDKEVKNILRKYQNLDAEVFINKLTFWEIIRCIQDLTKENKLVFADEIWIKLKLLQNWLDCLVYLRNSCSHWENILNKTMIKSVIWKDIEQIFGSENSKSYIFYFVILGIFRESLIPNYKWEEKVFKKMKQYNIPIEYFFTKKETFPNELESEAWKVLVNPLYEKYVKKSKE